MRSSRAVRSAQCAVRSLPPCSSVFATNGGDLNLYRQARTREKADALLDGRLKAPFTADANDVLCQWVSSGDYNPAGGLERIQAQVLAINAADGRAAPSGAASRWQTCFAVLRRDS